MFYEDSQKIGIGLILIGLIFYFFGVLWFLDRGFLAIGNISLTMGIISLVGVKQAAIFFCRKSKVFGSILFFSGFFMIIVGWFLFTTVGFLMQMYGLFLLFRQFMNTIFSFMQTLPVIGPFLRNSPFLHDAVDYIAGSGNKNGSKSSSKKFDV